MRAISYLVHHMREQKLFNSIVNNTIILRFTYDETQYLRVSVLYALFDNVNISLRRLEILFCFKWMKDYRRIREEDHNVSLNKKTDPGVVL